MGRTPEIDIPVAKPYKLRLAAEIKELGRDRVAELAGIDASTVHRNVNEGNLTYTTAMKLREAIETLRKEQRSSSPPTIPPPFIAVMSQGHYDLCNIAGELHELDADAFGTLFEKAMELKQKAEREHILDRAKQAIAHPIRKDSE